MKGKRPEAYKKKAWHFWGHDLFVNKHVLIPRFDTEILVEEALKQIGKRAKVLDLCTGSGAIAIALAKEGHDVTATDISHKALKVAMHNAKTHNLDIKFIKSDMFKNIQGKFDIIICNPPYIKTDEIGMFDETIFYEPRLALDGGEDGLKFYRIIAQQAGEYLTDGGLLALEIDDAVAVKRIFEEHGWQGIQVFKDLLGHDRVQTCSKTPKVI